MVLNQCSDEHHYACILGTIFPWGMFLEVEELDHREKLSLKLNEVCVCPGFWILLLEYLLWRWIQATEFHWETDEMSLLDGDMTPQSEVRCRWANGCWWTCWCWRTCICMVFLLEKRSAEFKFIRKPTGLVHSWHAWRCIVIPACHSNVGRARYLRSFSAI